MTVKAILLMGGQGARFGSSRPKQLHHISGKKIYLHTLETFLSSQLFDAIILVCHPDSLEEVEKDLLHIQDGSITLVPGGATRQESSYFGLLACGVGTDIVVIHDAVRPFVTHSILKENILLAKSYGAVDTCIPSADTIVHSKDGAQITEIPNRSEYLRGQTPQSFSYPLILKAHQTAHGNSATDDCQLVLKSGHPVFLTEGSDSNIKITTELDLFHAEQLFFRLKKESTLSQSMSLEGKTIAITGGTGGIGHALRQQITQAGGTAITISLSSSEFPADLSSYAETKAVFEAILKQHGPIDGLINCFGHLLVKELDMCSEEEINTLIDINLKGVIYCCQSVHLKPGGHLINIASSSYSRGRKGSTLYSAAKAGVVNFTQGLAEERPDLQVNVIAPQRTHTKMRTNSFPDEDPADLLSPCDVASEVLHLLQTEGVTGTILDVRRENITDPVQL